MEEGSILVSEALIQDLRNQSHQNHQRKRRSFEQRKGAARPIPMLSFSQVWFLAFYELNLLQCEMNEESNVKLTCEETFWDVHQSLAFQATQKVMATLVFKIFWGASQLNFYLETRVSVWTSLPSNNLEQKHLKVDRNSRT